MELKLFDSERKVMEVLWDHGDLSAKELADRLKELVGWSKTTTYTVIKKCIDKKAVSRSEPGFVCHPLVSREEVREQETDALIDRMYGGSADLLVANLLGSRRLSRRNWPASSGALKNWSDCHAVSAGTESHRRRVHPRRGCGTGAGHEPGCPGRPFFCSGPWPGPPASPLLHSLPH